MSWKTEMLPRLEFLGAALVPCGATKAPIEKAWQQKGYTVQEIIDMGDKVKAVGVNPKRCLYVCIDCDTAEAYDIIQNQGLPLPPTWQIGRFGDAERSKFIYSVTKEQKDRMPAHKGKWSKNGLEVFWNSQQFIVAGDHPTSKCYTWESDAETCTQLPNEWIDWLPRADESLQAKTRDVLEVELSTLLTREHQGQLDKGLGGEGNRNNSLFAFAADAYQVYTEAKRRESIDVRIIGTAEELIDEVLMRTDTTGLTKQEIEQTKRSAQEGRNVTAGFEGKWLYATRQAQNLVQRRVSPEKARTCRYEAIAALLPDGWAGKNADRKTRLDCGGLMGMLESQLGDRLRYNLLGYEVEIDGVKIKEDERPRLLGAIQNRGYAFGDETLCQALVAASARHEYHPVREYLEKLPPSNLDTVSLAAEFFGQEDMLQNVMLQRFLVGAVNRAIKPGCKMDYCAILQGAQGEGKSEFWRTLFGSKFYQSYNASKQDKDSYLALHCSWGIELAEFDAMTSRSSAILKNFITTARDMLRRPFGRKHEGLDRPSVFAGSCNTDDFLRDNTGERRYWVIEIRDRLDLKKVERMRDAVWSAIYADFKRGDRPFLPPELEVENEERNTDFTADSPLLDDVREIIRGKRWLEKKIVRDICKDKNLVPIGYLDKEIKRAMTQLGWSEDRCRLGKLRGPRYWRVDRGVNTESLRYEVLRILMGTRMSPEQLTWVQDQTKAPL